MSSRVHLATSNGQNWTIYQLGDEIVPYGSGLYMEW